VQIRPARPADVSAIEGIVERAYGPYVERIGRRPGPMDDDYARKVEPGQVAVAEDDSGLAGLIVLVPGEGHLLVENVAVEPARQHSGIGRALLAYAETAAAQLGLRELRLYTHVAMTENRRLYPRLGYREYARRADGEFERVFFLKELTPSNRATS
jgi:ribosomal protein S18 acetylase RimI-like enzyme